SLVDAAADAGPGGGFLGNHQPTRMPAGNERVGVAQEIHGIQVLPAAVAVRDPLALFATVIQVEHRSHRIDAQAVDMKFIQPVKGAGGEKIRDLQPTKIIDERVPVLVEAKTGILMLVESGAVKTDQPMRIRGKVCRYPVEDDADT